MELKGKNAIVTGAARGIGRGIALKLAEAGANVALVDLGNPKDPALTYNLAAHGELASAVDEVKSHGVKAVAILADVTRAADCERMAAETVKAVPPPSNTTASFGKRTYSNLRPVSVRHTQKLCGLRMP